MRENRRKLIENMRASRNEHLSSDIIDKFRASQSLKRRDRDSQDWSNNQNSLADRGTLVLDNSAIEHDVNRVLARRGNGHGQRGGSIDSRAMDYLRKVSTDATSRPSKKSRISSQPKSSVAPAHFQDHESHDNDRERKRRSFNGAVEEEYEGGRDGDMNKRRSLSS